VRVAREAYSITSLIALGYQFGASGPPYGVWIHYFLASAPGEPIALTILDPQGRPIRTFSSVATPAKPAPLGPYAHRLRGAAAILATRGADEEDAGVRTGVLPPEMQARPTNSVRLSARAGLNRFVWDLRYPDARTVPGLAPGGITAPLAPPGRYGVRLEVGDERWEEFCTILPDPRLDTTPESYAAQFALLRGIRDLVTAIHEAVGTLRDLREQASDRLGRLRQDATPTERARVALIELDAILTVLEESLIQPRINEAAREQEGLNSPVGFDIKLAALGYFVAKSDRAPTSQQHAVFADLSARAERELVSLRALQITRVASVNEALMETGVPRLYPLMG